MLSLREICYTYPSMCAGFAMWVLKDGVLHQVESEVGDVEPELLIGPACRYGKRLTGEYTPIRKQGSLEALIKYIQNRLLREGTPPPYTPMKEALALMSVPCATKPQEPSA